MSEHQRKAQTRRRLRWFLAILCAALSIVTCAWAVIYKITKIEPERTAGVELLPFNDAAKEAIHIRVDHAKNLFEFGLLALSALWALVIANRDQARIGSGDRPELIMFLSATLALLLSLLWHEFYLDELGHYIRVGANSEFEIKKSIPDVFNLSLNFLFTFQIYFLVIGAFQFVITMLSAHRIKEAK